MDDIQASRNAPVSHYAPAAETRRFCSFVSCNESKGAVRLEIASLNLSF